MALISIERCTASAGDRLMVDANVWMIYTSPSELPRQNKYISFIQRSRKAGATLFVSALTLAELAHPFERIQRDLVMEKRRLSELTLKQFRLQYPTERRTGVDQFDFALVQIQQVATVVPARVGSESLKEMLTLLQTNPLDGYDALLLHQAIENGITKILTDDCDYANVTGFDIYTSNPRLLKTA